VSFVFKKVFAVDSKIKKQPIYEPLIGAIHCKIVLKVSMLNYGAPFGFIFRDKSWLRKFAIASLLTYTLVGAAPVLGWTIETVRRVARGEEPALPELKDWKTFWSLGGKFALVNALWLLPLLFAVLLLYGVPALLIGRLPDTSVLWVFGGTLACVFGFLLVYSLVYVFFLPPMMAALAQGDSAWRAANPLRLWKIVRPRFMEYALIFTIVGIALFNILFLLAALTLFLLLPPLLVYAGLVAAHFTGQLSRNGGLNAND